MGLLTGQTGPLAIRSKFFSSSVFLKPSPEAILPGSVFVRPTMEQACNEGCTMPLHRSARLFTLGLALAGTCTAQNKLETEQTKHSQPAQLKPKKAQVKANLAERKALHARQQRRAESAPSKTKA